jgi:hypothetical protein
MVYENLPLAFDILCNKRAVLDRGQGWTRTATAVSFSTTNTPVASGRG